MKSFLSLLFLACNISFATIRLPAVFSDHMVLQQNEEVKIFGWGNPSEKIVIKPSWNSIEYTTVTNNLAVWEVKIKTPNAGGPYVIEFKGENTVVLKDILIGEVWLCSGQSNMEMSASWGINNGDYEVDNANNNNIRFFNVPKTSSTNKQNNLLAVWEVCNSETMKKSSAVAYFFAQRLQKHLNNVPVGLIISAWGGTPIETWMPKEVIENDTILLEAANKLNPVEWGPVDPAMTFNTMIYPLINFNIAGVIWYQGEANVGALNYNKSFAALIQSWRTLWKNEFPFYYVQISPYDYGKDNFWGVEIRDAQRKILNDLPNLGMVVTSDISTIEDIHPKDKKTVGIRLANLSLVNHYVAFKSIVDGPLFKGYSINGSKISVYFENGEGLYFKDKKVSLFEIAGDDEKFYVGKVKIVNQVIEIESKKVKHPKFIRFAWKNTSKSNLYNKANLPASSFKTN